MQAHHHDTSCQHVCIHHSNSETWNAGPALRSSSCGGKFPPKTENDVSFLIESEGVDSGLFFAWGGG